MNIVTVKINNWEAYQTKQDKSKSARHHWFSFSNTFFDDHKISCLDSDEKLVFIYLLCELSKAQRPNKGELPDEIFINLDFLGRSIGVQPDKAREAIKKLDYLQLVTDLSTSLVPDSDQTRTKLGPYITEHNITQENISIAQSDDRASEESLKKAKPRSTGFRLTNEMIEDLYQYFPRKQGKKKGVARLKAICKTEADYDKVYTAVFNYYEYCEALNKEQRYIKQFDSFMSIWEDWSSVELTHELIKQEQSDNKANKRSY